MAGVWEETFPFRALRGFVWVDTSVKTPAWRRRHSRRACFPGQGKGGPPMGAAGTPWRLGCSCHPTQLASQQCTQMAQNGVERPFSPICVHSCVPTPVHNVATVYTNAPKWLREAVFANLCTLLRHHGRSRDRAGLRVPRVGDHHIRRQLESKTHALAGQTPPVLRLKAARYKTGGVVGHTAFKRVCYVRRCHARSKRYSWTTTTSPISVRS